MIHKSNFKPRTVEENSSSTERPPVVRQAFDDEFSLNVFYNKLLSLAFQQKKDNYHLKRADPSSLGRLAF